MYCTIFVLVLLNYPRKNPTCMYIDVDALLKCVYQGLRTLKSEEVCIIGSSREVLKHGCAIFAQ